MILLIDAYNVLKQMISSGFIGESDRKKFIKQLGWYAKKRQHKIVLVFDGGPYDRATQERISGIYVVYSGVLESADDYIKRYLKDHKELDMMLISSDRELRDVAGVFKLESMPANEFYTILQNTLSIGDRYEGQITETVKTSDEENPELDQLMRDGSKVVHSKVEDFMQKKSSRKSKAHRPSKKERKKMKKIKKL